MTNDELYEYFVYERRGILRRIKLSGRATEFPWYLVGPYLTTHFHRRKYLLHRLIWQYHTGEIPSRIDHKDNNPLNNKFSNLRLCTNRQNAYNCKIFDTNTSGFKGVRLVSDRSLTKPWRATICTDGFSLHLGYFETRELAASAYLNAAKQHAGAFARVA